MFNPRIAMGAMKGPVQKMAGRLTQGIVQAKLRQWQKQNPQLYKEAMALVSGKTDEQLKVIADGLAEELGVDLGSIAEAFGIKL